MPIKYYAKVEEIEEAQRGNAIELKDGRFALDEPADPLGANGKAALEAERKRADEAERLRKAAETKAAELEREKDALAKGVTEAQLAEIRQKEADARKPIEDENAKLKAENEKLKLDDKVQAAFLANGGHPERVEDAMLALKSRARLGDSGGVIYKDKDGKDTADDAAAFFASFKSQKSWLFKGPGGSGSGTGGSNGTDDTPLTKPDVRTAEHRAAVAGAF